MPAGVAAGHPATTEVGLRVLAAGGSAADAAVAAMLAGCVAESVLTGIGGGGFATYYEAASRQRDLPGLLLRGTRARRRHDSPARWCRSRWPSAASRWRTRSAGRASACPACRPAAASCTGAGAGCLVEGGRAGGHAGPHRRRCCRRRRPARSPRSPRPCCRATVRRSTPPAGTCSRAASCCYHPGLRHRARRARRRRARTCSTPAAIGSLHGRRGPRGRRRDRPGRPVRVPGPGTAGTQCRAGRPDGLRPAPT